MKKLGFYISISGIATFRNADELRDVVRNLPLERILVETDAPYLAPVPHRGKQNEPLFVSHVAQLVADIKGVSLEGIGTSDQSELPPTIWLVRVVKIICLYLCLFCE